MAQGYYTLEEAAVLLGMAVDELKGLARRGEVRSFQDRGTWRFRVQDIQELARQRGLGSEPDLTLGESGKPTPKKKTSGIKQNLPPKSSPKMGDAASAQPMPPAPAPEMFAFDLPDQETVGIGQEPRSTGGKKSGPKSGLGGPKTPTPGPESPPPRKKTSGVIKAPEPGSDSDVRLVGDAGVDFGIQVDSDVKLGASPTPKKKSSGKLSGKPSGLAPGQSGTSQRRHSDVKPSAPDSGVRLVPMDSDSDVRIVGSDSGTDEIPLGASPPKSAADSDIRLELSEPGTPPTPSGALTEEIDLDAELRKQQGQQPARAVPAKPAPGKPASAAESPFELSDADYNMPDASSVNKQPGVDSSSDFELTPASELSSPVEPGSDEFDLPMPADADAFGLGSSSSDKPLPLAGDSGISLEQESEGSDEFDLNLKGDQRGKAPAAQLPGADSSEFELSLGADDSSGEMSALEESSSEVEMPRAAAGGAAAADSSEFELTLDVDESSSEFELTIDATGEGAAGPDLASDSEFELQLEDTGLESSSEFELTIDDDLQLVPDEEATPQVSLEEEIAHTDLDEGSLLDDESSSGVVALEEDTGLEDSDFEIAVDQESSSEVVALEDEFSLEEEPVIGDKGAGFEEDFGVGDEAVAEGPVERETVIVERDVYAAPWSAWPVIVLLPCVVVMFFIGLMGFEMIQSLNGYQEPGYITKTLTDMIGINK